jgi:hypothetical protein
LRQFWELNAMSSNLIILFLGVAEWFKALFC